MRRAVSRAARGRGSTSAAMMIGSLRTRSSSTPACSDTSANGSVSSATRMPICSGVACSSSAAVSGSARLVICAPNDVIVSDSHSRRKSGSRHRPRKLRRSSACDALEELHRASFCRTTTRAAPADATGGSFENGGMTRCRIPAGTRRTSARECYGIRSCDAADANAGAAIAQCIAPGSDARTSARRRDVKASEMDDGVMRSSVRRC